MPNKNTIQYQYLSEYLPYSFDELFEYAKGGIHIDPAKKGTFKAQATRMDMGVQEAAAHILANKEDYSPAMVKKANFARNFAKEYGGEPQNPGFQALPEYVQEKILDNMAYGGGVDLDEYGKGGYTVRRTSERKGKTHVVTGPDGTKKYFGDPKMGERGKSKLGKEAFYARHADNLKKNPYFRAYARATWEEGGEIDEYAKGGEMIKRADGSYSQRGFWDNIRANKGSGKKPTKEMLAMEKKLKSKQEGGQQEQIMQLIEMYAQMAGIQPQELLAQLQKMEPEQQQVALQQIAQEVQQAMQSQQDGVEEQTEMQFGGSRYTNFANNSVNRGAMSMVDMMDPSKSALPYLGMADNPISAVANIVGGLASGLGASYLGYKSLFQNNESPYEQSFNQMNNQAANINPNLNLKQSNVANTYFRQQPNSTFKKYGMQQPNAVFKKYSYDLPQDYQYLNNFEFAYGGDIPKAQFAGQQNNLPFSLNTTGNYSDYQRTPSAGYQYDINTPFTEVAANLNINPQFANRHNKNVVNNNSLKLNNQKAAMLGLSGLAAANAGFRYFDNAKQQRNLEAMYAANNNTMAGNSFNNPSPFGDNLTNVQAGAPQLKPNMYVPIQDIGTNMFAKYGGQYQAGGEYKVSQDQLIQLMRDGAEIEFID
jgi:hypothetical protein